MKQYWAHASAIFVVVAVGLSLKGCAEDFTNKRESEMVNEGNGIFQQLGEVWEDIRNGVDG